VDPDPYGEYGYGARKLRNFSGKNALQLFFKKILPLKRYKIALTNF
jgi:hypothetical protein